MYDLVIRHGTLYDGTGAPPFAGDLAIEGDRIVAVGELDESRIDPRSTKEIDATGQIVTPGFVDAHTHYDGQVTWDPFVSPSSWHGVTTIVTGNCGVGFAPCRPEQRDWLIGLMEGVEDIPGSALHEGIRWRWETFPEYLDALDTTPLAIDVGTQIPHGAIRAYVMGERGPAHEVATGAEIDEMARVVREALEAGALGFSTSRTEKHKDSKGVVTPSIRAHEAELVGIARALRETGRGVLQGISDFYDFESEFEMFRRMAEVSGRPASITVEQQDARPDWWRRLLEAVTHAREQGLEMRGQVPPRATGVLLGLTATLNPFSFHPSFGLTALNPDTGEIRSVEERAERLRDPAVRARILSEEPRSAGPLVDEILRGFHKMFRLGDPADYEPDPRDSVAGIAEREGRTPQEVVYDMMLEKDGKALIYHPLFNYLPGNLDFVEEMLDHPHTVFGLSDGGAHCGVLCDASFPTTLIQHWGRDRKRGRRFPLERLISMQTKETAELVGLYDRGQLRPGYKADVNVIDFEHLALHEPTVAYDLPAGGRRLVQRATGYTATIVAGRVAFEEGVPTGELAGSLVRGSQPAPAS
ncbi:MAG TPA: amidohydrolase family protein [Myxococcota bacterium]|nr:amidohydrolase family protein [Myxococcota bacterium]